jgi:hypothetical protein
MGVKPSARSRAPSATRSTARPLSTYTCAEEEGDGGGRGECGWVGGEAVVEVKDSSPPPTLFFPRTYRAAAHCAPRPKHSQERPPTQCSHFHRFPPSPSAYTLTSIGSGARTSPYRSSTTSWTAHCRKRARGGVLSVTSAARGTMPSVVMRNTRFCAGARREGPHEENGRAPAAMAHSQWTADSAACSRTAPPAARMAWPRRNIVNFAAFRHFENPQQHNFSLLACCLLATAITCGTGRLSCGRSHSGTPQARERGVHGPCTSGPGPLTWLGQPPSFPHRV